MNLTSSIANTIQELVVQLSRKNTNPAMELAERVDADLKTILTSELNPSSALRLQAQQAMYAIEECLTLIDESDLRGAWEAAREASKEWRAIPQKQE